jgi:hypothetical protein
MEKSIPYYSKGEAFKNQGKVALEMSSAGPFAAAQRRRFPHGSSEEG